MIRLFLLLAGFMHPAVAGAETWRVIYNVFPPYSYVAEDGTASGYGIELVSELAGQAGAQVEFQLADNPAQIVSALANGDADISVALVETEERRTNAIFTVPHRSISMDIYALAENADYVAENWPEVRVGFSEGSYPASIAARIPEIQGYPGPSNPDVLLSLIEGRIDAAIYPDIGFQRLIGTIDTRRDFVAVGAPLEQVPVRMAITRTKPELAARLDQQLSSFLVTPAYSDLVARTLGGPATGGWTHQSVFAALFGVAGSLSLIGLAVIMRIRRQSHRAMIRAAEEKAAVQLSAARELKTRNTRLEQKMRELEELLYVVSHDLSSPLVSISGFTRSASKASLAGNHDRVPNLLERVETNVRGMSQLIEGILKVSRIGLQTPKVEAFQLADLVDDLRTRLDGMLGDKGIRLVSTRDIRLQTDWQMFGRALQNLVENAIKHGCRRKGDSVKIVVDDSNDRMRIGVEDTGPGVPEDLRGRIFEMYQRLERDGGGSGLGLSIVSRIAEQLSADVYVDCEGRSGATFWFEFHKDADARLEVAA